MDKQELESITTRIKFVEGEMRCTEEIDYKLGVALVILRGILKGDTPYLEGIQAADAIINEMLGGLKDMDLGKISTELAEAIDRLEGASLKREDA